MGMGKDWKGWSHQEEPWRWTWEWKMCVESADLGGAQQEWEKGVLLPQVGLVGPKPPLLFLCLFMRS